MVGFEVASSQADATQTAKQAAEDYRQQNIQSIAQSNLSKEEQAIQRAEQAAEEYKQNK